MSTFNKSSTAEEVTEGLDLSGRSALVTGCTNGCGLETMRVLAMRGAHVLATGRTIEKVEKASAGMPGKITPLALELTDLDSVNQCARAVIDSGIIPDIVIFNAGLNIFGDGEFVNGIEKHFFANFLGHFVLIDNLMPTLLKLDSGRIVHVASDSAYKDDDKGPPPEGINFDNLRGEGEYSMPTAYASSKLANALLSFELSHRLEGTGWTSNAIHPGSVFSNIASTWPAEIQKLMKEYESRAKTVAQGAATQVYAATSPELEGVTGQFLSDSNIIEPPKPNYLEDKAMAEKLWRVGEEMAEGHLTV